MIAEREHLLPLAEEGFDLASLHFPQINPAAALRVLTNFYSTPLPVGTSVEVKVYSAYVEIWHAGQCVARHERCYERHQKVLELEHYLDALRRSREHWPVRRRWNSAAHKDAGPPAMTVLGDC